MCEARGGDGDSGELLEGSKGNDPEKNLRDSRRNVVASANC
jgi:hypothetical protein